MSGTFDDKRRLRRQILHLVALFTAQATSLPARLSNHFPVLYHDTDSIFVALPPSSDMWQAVIDKGVPIRDLYNKRKPRRVPFKLICSSCREFERPTRVYVPELQSQSISEPSMAVTLNRFHSAGRELQAPSDPSVARQTGDERKQLQEERPHFYNRISHLILANYQSSRPMASFQRWMESLYDSKYGSDENVSITDREIADQAQASLCFGELLPAGVETAINSMLNDVEWKGEPINLFDLGAGPGRLVLQAFLLEPRLRQVVGIELAPSRFQKGFMALVRLVQFNPECFRLVDLSKEHITIKLRTQNKRAPFLLADSKGDVKWRWKPLPPCSSRSLTYRLGNLFSLQEIVCQRRCLILLETALPATANAQLDSFFSKLCVGSRILSYQHLNHPCLQGKDMVEVAVSWGRQQCALYFYQVQQMPPSLSEPALGKFYDVEGFMSDVLSLVVEEEVD